MFWAPLGIIATFVTSTSAQTVWLASSPGYSVPILSINKKTLWYLELDLTDRYVQGGKRRGRRRYWGGKHDEKEGCSHFQWHVHTPPSSSYTQLSSNKDKAKRAKNALPKYDVTCYEFNHFQPCVTLSRCKGGSKDVPTARGDNTDGRERARQWCRWLHWAGTHTKGWWGNWH